MPKKLDSPTEKVTIRLNAGDKDVLQRFYPQVGYNAAIRHIVSRHAAALVEQESRESAGLPNASPSLAVDLIKLGADANV